MSYRYNPLIFSGLDLTGGSGGGAPFFMPPVATEGDLPPIATDGEMRVVLATDHIYVYNGDTGLWRDTGATEGTAFGTTPNDQAYDLEVQVIGGIERNVLVLQPADATHPGDVSILDQSFTGIKSFETELRVPYAATASSPARLNVNKALVSGQIDLSNTDTTGQLNATRVGTGTVDNTEFGYLNGVTSPIQTQLNNKLNRSAGDIDETLFSGTQSATAVSVTGFLFASSVRTFEAIVDIQVNATTDLYEYKKLIGINKGTSWQLYTQSFGDDTDVDFNITSGGQVQYTSLTYAGFVSLEIKFRALTLNN